MDKTMQSFEGIPLEVQKKKGNRNMYLRIRRDGSILVTAPARTPDRAVLKFLSARQDWIRTAVEKVTLRNLPDPPGFFRLWGSQVPFSVLKGRPGRVSFENNALTVFCPHPEDSGKADILLWKWCAEELKSQLPDLLYECEQLTGKHASSVSVRQMVSRWGSCNTKTASVTLNLRLVRHDPVFLRYVLIHELVHLYEPNHSRRFYELMDRFCPEWKDLRRQLKSIPF